LPAQARIAIASAFPYYGHSCKPATITGRFVKVDDLIFTVHHLSARIAADTAIRSYMFYAIISEDVENSLPLRLQARPAHLVRVQALADAGRLVIAGPHPAIDDENPGAAGFSGSLIVAQFDSLHGAQAWAADDPYVAAGVYKKVTVKPFKQVLP